MNIHAQRGHTQHECAEYERSCRGRHKATLFFSSKNINMPTTNSKMSSSSYYILLKRLKQIKQLQLNRS
jgi:hypothetical protein